jgi:tRNA dimethylallyltransferase
MKNPPIICLMGPTASGKTDLAFSLVDKLPCDIVSVDSAMIYKGMDIGTAKPSQAQLASAPHRLIDILDPSETYSAGQFCLDAHREIQSIWAKGRIPLLVGGTMMYFHALQQGLSPLPQADANVRKMLAQEADRLGWPALHQRLVEIDPVVGQRIDINDKQRIQRALEIYELTEKPPSDAFKQANPLFPADQFFSIALMLQDRQVLHGRIAQRFKEMLDKGLIEEVQKLRQREDLSADMPSLKTVGYRQVWAYLAGDLNAHEMKEKAVTATRQLAKRQLTWLKSWSHVQMFEACTPKLFADVYKTILPKLHS